MKTTVLAAGAAFLLTAAAFSGGAQAQCWWNGFNWSCASAPTPYYESTWGAMPYGYDPGYPTINPYTGYKPAWLPSFVGPRPSSGAGR